LNNLSNVGTKDDGTTRIDSPHTTRHSHLPNHMQPVRSSVKETWPEMVVCGLPVAEPINLATGILGMHRAAKMFHDDPMHGREARAKLLLAISEVSSFLYAASSYTHPFGILVTLALTSGVKLLNAAYKAALSSSSNQKSDPLLTTSARIAELPLMKQTLNLLLVSLYRVEQSVHNVLDPLKDNFASNAPQSERELGERLLRSYAALHDSCHPDTPIDIERLKEQLIDPRAQDHACVIREGERVLGGFTYTVSLTESDKKAMNVTSISPTKESNPEHYILVIHEIVEQALRADCTECSIQAGTLYR
jgi:hypothetical protein